LDLMEVCLIKGIILLCFYSFRNRDWLMTLSSFNCYLRMVCRSEGIQYRRKWSYCKEYTNPFHEYIQLGQDCSLINPLQFIIHSHAIIWYYELIKVK
jgi:hypothetical protein